MDAGMVRSPMPYFEISGEQIPFSDLIDWSLDVANDQERPKWVNALATTILEWHNDKNIILIKTSGSTGTPKRISLEKSRIKSSALKTATRFDLIRGMTSLNCLPTQYIAGKLMVIRALITGMNQICIEPKLALDIPMNTGIDFTAMTPMQIESTLGREPNSFNQIKSVIIGGSPIPLQLFPTLISLNTRCFATYGMTETITHIAVSEIRDNHQPLIYEALEGVSFETKGGSLVIYADHLQDVIYTNDVVELLDEHRFIWKGRKDHVINRGGVKVNPETVEERLQPFCPYSLLLAGVEEERSGQVPVLFIETDASWKFSEDFSHALSALPKLWGPVRTYLVPRFQRTPTGKIIRDANLYLAQSTLRSENSL